MAVQQHVRGLQRVWVPEHGCWVFVWCHDDGDVVRNHRLAYSIVSSPAEFLPSGGQFILASSSSKSDDDDSFKYVYGVPYWMESVLGSIKLYFTDFTPALAQPNDNETGSGKNPDTWAFYLEGQWSQEDLNGGPLLWTRKGQNLHNNPSHVIEISDIQDADDHLAYGAPCGTMLIQYDRDVAGRIKVDDDTGVPLIKKIDGSVDDDDLKNYKIGYLALDFVKDYFGDGLHGWVGRNFNHFPWEISIEEDGVHVRLGSVNSLLAQNALTNGHTTAFPIDTSVDGIWYVKIKCDTDGKNVTQITLIVDQIPIPIDSVGMQCTMTTTPPLFFDHLGVIIVNQHKTYIYQIRNTNLTALPVIAFVTSKSDGLVPGQEPFDRWFRWSLTSS